MNKAISILIAIVAASEFSYFAFRALDTVAHAHAIAEIAAPAGR